MTKKPKLRGRYSIGEWYGVGFETLTPADRFRLAKIEYDLDALTGTPCPFQADTKCNKKGGVCSLRLYQQVGDGPVTGTGPIITTCPQRFLEANSIFRWVSENPPQSFQPFATNLVGTGVPLAITITNSGFGPSFYRLTVE